MSLLLFEALGRRTRLDVRTSKADRGASPAITRGGVAERWTALALLAVVGCSAASSPSPPPPTEIAVRVGSDGSLQTDHTCFGADHSPMISWDPASLPPSASHMTLRVRSPDGIIWTAWDFPVSTGVLHEAVEAASAPPLQGVNYRGRIGWAGPCPPKGTLGTVVESMVEMEVFATSGAVEAPPSVSAAKVVARARARTVGYVLLPLDLDLR